MPSPSSSWRLPVFSLDCLGRQGRGCMGCGSAAGRVCDFFSLASSSFSVSRNPAFLLSPVHQGKSLGVEDSGSVAEGCDRACFPVFGVLQLHVRGDQGVRGLEADYRSVGSKSFCGKDPVQDGDHSVGTLFDPPVQLDGFSGSQGCVPSSSSASFKLQVSAVRGRGQDVAVSSLVLRPQVFTRVMALVSAFLHRLGIRVPRHLGEGHCFGPLRGPENHCESREVLADSFSGCVVSMGKDRFADFPSFADSFEDRKVLLSSRRISVIKRAVCEILEGSVGSPGFSSPSGSRGSSPGALVSAVSANTLGFPGRISDYLVEHLSRRPSLVVRRGSSGGGRFVRVPPSGPDVVVRRVGSRLVSYRL